MSLSAAEAVMKIGQDFRLCDGTVLVANCDSFLNYRYSEQKLNQREQDPLQCRLWRSITISVTYPV